MTSCASGYPERDLNPHSRYGHRILSPACLPFHHPGIFMSSSRAVVQSADGYSFSLFQKTLLLRVGPCPAQREFHHPGIFMSSNRAVVQSADGYSFSLFQKTLLLRVGPCPAQREFHHPGIFMSCNHAVSGWIFLLFISKNSSPGCRTLSRAVGIPPSGHLYVKQSCSRAVSGWIFLLLISKNSTPACWTLSRAAGIPPSGHLYVVQSCNRAVVQSCSSRYVPLKRNSSTCCRAGLLLQKTQMAVQIYNKLLYQYRFTESYLFKVLQLCGRITGHDIVHP